ncbi:MAG: YihY/virulence factor BrkB family protein [Ruminococcaceae bacterium]|nr:YihY/virulence factor BrkB family protein [Oscillospiraceae bacterium]
MFKKIIKNLDNRFCDNRFYRFLKELFRRIKEDQISATGAQLAYYLVLSFFPFLIFLLTLVPYTPLASEEVLTQILANLPSNTRELLEPIVVEVVSQRSVALLSSALFLALWSGSSGMANLLNAMTAAFDITNMRPGIVKRLISVFFTLMLALIIIISMVSQVFGDQLIQAVIRLINNSIATGTITLLWDLTRTVLPLIVMTLGFTLLFKFGPGFPANQKVSFKEALLGGTFAAVAWMLISLGFSFYVDNFSNYSRTYGSLGGIIVLLIWLYISSFVIMLGAEVTASYITVYKGGLRHTLSLEITEADD